MHTHDDHPGQGSNESAKTLKEILDGPIPHKIFLYYCVIGVSLDPLFFYIPIINDKEKCIGMDKNLKIIVLVLMSIMNLSYIFHIVFKIFFGYGGLLADTSKSGGFSTFCGVRQIKGVIRRKWRIIIIDILCVLPIPQVIILFYFPKMIDPKSLNWRKVLNFLLLFQFVPRIIRIHLSCKELTKNQIVRDSRVKGLFNFFLYIIGSHVFGAFWYFFSVQRESACWRQACKEESNCDQLSFSCKREDNFVNETVISYFNQSCSHIPSSSFDFGMFTPALQSEIVNSLDFPRKFFYCFAWGLRNLSSFGSNLQPSSNVWESMFSVAITIIGLLLFIYLIGNLETYLQFSANYSENRRRNMEKKEVEIEKWIESNEIPQDMGKELKARVREKMDINEDVNLENLVNVLPTQSKKRIKQHLCLPILKKVPRLEKMNDKSIDIIIDHLKPVIFNEHTEIIREGEPLRQMLFFTQGSTSVYSRDTIPSKLKRGDFYGAELLDLAPEASSTHFPKSEKTVKTDTKIEAFALDAQDMKKIAVSLRKETDKKDEEGVGSSVTTSQMYSLVGLFTSPRPITRPT